MSDPVTRRSEPMDVFARQALRTALVTEWFDALGLGTGDRVADLGCGGGYTSLRAAERVGPTGVVHAIDVREDLIAFLAELAELHDLHAIRTRVEDVTQLSPLPEPPAAVLLTMVVHHLDHPADALRHIARVTARAPILIAEFDADGPCRVGPPARVRLPRHRFEAIVDAAGLTADPVCRQSAEHWFTILRSAA